MNQAINAYYNITAESEFRERVRLWEKARHDEASALHYAEQKGEQRANEKWQIIVADKDEKWKSIIAENKAIIADKDAEIARLKTELEKR